MSVALVRLLRAWCRFEKVFVFLLQVALFLHDTYAILKHAQMKTK